MESVITFEKVTPALDTIPAAVCGVLSINLGAVASNYRTLSSHLKSGSIAAVLKADAYGLGLVPVGQTLASAGCQNFFVAHLEEALELRSHLNHANIYVLSGVLKGTESDFRHHNITPVLNDYEMTERWANQPHTASIPAVLHVDTGMNRNGFDGPDLKHLLQNASLLERLDVKYLMSHLACAPDPSHPLNTQQRETFEQLRRLFPGLKGSLADTAGLYLGPEYHYDLTRSGKGIVGMYEAPTGPKLQNVATFQARVIQIREAKKGETVGYNANVTLEKDTRLAVLGVGFADGLDRRLSHGGSVMLGGHKAPIVGTLSMDYTVVDISHAPSVQVGDWAEVFGDALSIQDVAHQIQTISREISTRLGKRLLRVYTN